MAHQPGHLVGLIGTGITASLTPPTHMAEAAAQQIPYIYRTIDLTSLGLESTQLAEIMDWAERLGYDALNITHPCKVTVLDYLDTVDPVAEALGAVNTVLLTPEGRIGYNTDTTGFEHAFQQGLPGALTSQVVQLGAGGAGVAVADALMRSGVESLTIVDLDQSRAGSLAARLTERHGATGHAVAITPDQVAESIATADGLVNCTPIGMHDHPGVPVDPTLLRASMWVADIVYLPLETELIRAAKAAGCTTLHGGNMAVGQAVDTFRLITGTEPDVARMMQHFQKLIAR